LLLSVKRAITGPIGAAILVPKNRRRLTGTVRERYFNSTGESELDGITIERNGFAGAVETGEILWPAFLRWLRSRSTTLTDYWSPAFAMGRSKRGQPPTQICLCAKQSLRLTHALCRGTEVAMRS
jgi:hypothetical protein